MLWPVSEKGWVSNTSRNTVEHLHKPCRRSPRIRKRRIGFAVFSFCACFSAKSEAVQTCCATRPNGIVEAIAEFQLSD